MRSGWPARSGSLRRGSSCSKAARHRARRACPRGRAGGSSPSEGRGRSSRAGFQVALRPLMQEEIKALLRMLSAMAPNDPDRPKVLDRIASDYFEDERDNYRDCLGVLVMLEADRFPLSQLEARLNEARARYLAARANRPATCKKLEAEHPTFRPRGLRTALPGYR